MTNLRNTFAAIFGQRSNDWRAFRTRNGLHFASADTKQSVNPKINSAQLNIQFCCRNFANKTPHLLARSILPRTRKMHSPKFMKLLRRAFASARNALRNDSPPAVEEFPRAVSNSGLIFCVNILKKTKRFGIACKLIFYILLLIRTAAGGGSTPRHYFFFRAIRNLMDFWGGTKNLRFEDGLVKGANYPQN